MITNHQIKMPNFFSVFLFPEYAELMFTIITNHQIKMQEQTCLCEKERKIKSPCSSSPNSSSSVRQIRAQCVKTIHILENKYDVLQRLRKLDIKERSTSSHGVSSYVSLPLFDMPFSPCLSTTIGPWRYACYLACGHIHPCSSCTLPLMIE